jgi:hypothetical protein
MFYINSVYRHALLVYVGISVTACMHMKNPSMSLLYITDYEQLISSWY